MSAWLLLVLLLFLILQWQHVPKQPGLKVNRAHCPYHWLYHCIYAYLFISRQNYQELKYFFLLSFFSHQNTTIKVFIPLAFCYGKIAVYVKLLELWNIHLIYLSKTVMCWLRSLLKALNERQTNAFLLSSSLLVNPCFS